MLQLELRQSISSSTRGGTWCYDSPGSQTGPVDFITIASQGNAINYGDLSVTRIGTGGTGNSVSWWL